MSTRSMPAPRLTVLNGPLAGNHFDLGPGRHVVGREAGVGIVLAGDGVSRIHAAVERAGRRVTVTDLNSTNGTHVNQRPLRGVHELREGDLLEIGPFLLRYSAGDSTTGVIPPQRYDFGGVRGAVQTGDGTQYGASRDQYVSHGDQYLSGRDRYQNVTAHHGMAAGRDLYANDYSVEVNADYDPWDEAFQGEGFGRVLMIIGGLVALAGFGLWMYLIIGVGFEGGDPFSMEVFGLPAPLLGFGGFALGGIVAAIGSGMSKAARKREQRRRRARPY